MTIRRWCRRHLRIGRCDERYSHFHFHQSFGQRPNSLAQHTTILIFEQLSNDRQEISRKRRPEIPLGSVASLERFPA